MSGRGRGRGRGAAKIDDRSSSSSTSSSRNSSLTRTGPASTTISTTHDTNRLIKELGSGTGGTANLTTNAPGARKFVPNLAASRKNDTQSTSSSSVPTSNETSENKKATENGNRFPMGRGDFRVPRGGRGNFMQMPGIFDTNAQIPTTAPSMSSGRGGSAGSKREDSLSNSRAGFQKKFAASITPKTIIGDVDGLKYEIDEEYEPRQIPIAERKSIFDIKQEPGATKVKMPPILPSSSHIDSFVHLFQQQKIESTTSKPLIKDEPIEQTDLSEILPPPPPPLQSNIDPSQLILMQFPDVLPCVRTSSSSSKPELASLTDLPDGFLGKLQIFKSGKCRLKLSADTYLDVDIARPTSFLQNVMVTDMTTTTTAAGNNTATTNNDMNKLVCLGDIKHKLTVSLNVDHVLEDTR